MTDPTSTPDEPGAYVGHEPERQAETIPGGVGPEDERIAAHSTQPGFDRDEIDETVTADERGQGASGPA